MKIEAYIRETCGTVYRPISTCAPGHRPDGSYGLGTTGTWGDDVTGRRCVHHANNYHRKYELPTIAIAEKAADLIKAAGRISQQTQLAIARH